MSYCVHCGVELNASAARCPLCGTPVIDPGQSACPEQDPYFPTRRVEVLPVSRKMLAFLLSVMLISVGLCCTVSNLFLRPDFRWSLYVVGAAAMLWVWFVAPLLARKMPLWGKLMLDVAAVGLYAHLISIALHGQWFNGLVLPVMVLAVVMIGVFGYLLRGGRRSILTSVTVSVGAVGLFAIGVEAIGDYYFYGCWQPGWSLVVFTVCIGVALPLVVVRRVPSLREEARRRFHV